MDQVSRPLLLALVVVAGFAGVWLLVLRPGGQNGAGTAAAPPTMTAPGTGGLGRAVDKAKGAVGTSQASAQATEAAVAAGGAQTMPAPAASPVAPAPAGPARPAAPAAPDTVLLFAGAGPVDDAARSVVRSVRRPGVRVVIASLSQVADYQDLLGTIQITASPTILVFGPDRRAQRIEGLPDAGQVEQALRAAG